MKKVRPKIEQAKEIINETLSKAKHPFVEFTGGKDSLVTLSLVKEVSSGPVSVLFIDTSAHFTEIYHFVEKIRKLWKLNLLIERNESIISKMELGKDRKACCHQLKALTRLAAIKKLGIDYLFTGFTGEDMGEMSPEDTPSQKEVFKEIRPIFDYSESEVWEYIKKANLPYCTLYDKGYRSIDCIPCTEMTGVKPESGEKDNSQEIMKKLKQLGYM